MLKLTIEGVSKVFNIVLRKRSTLLPGIYTVLFHAGAIAPCRSKAGEVSMAQINPNIETDNTVTGILNWPHSSEKSAHLFNPITLQG